jgi:hypothetical protein
MTLNVADVLLPPGETLRVSVKPSLRRRASLEN